MDGLEPFGDNAEKRAMFDIFKKKPNHQENAKRLLNYCRIMNTSSTVSLIDRFPELDQLFRQPGFDIEKSWDFFMVSAGLGTGLFLYGCDHIKEIPALAEQLTSIASVWDSRSPAAIADFQSFVDEKLKLGVDFPTSIGALVVWNTKGEPPTIDDIPATIAIGTLILNQLQGWYK